MVTSVAPGGQVESDWTFHRGGGEGLAAACSLGLVVGFMFGKKLRRPALVAGVGPSRRVGGWIDVRCSTFSLATHRDPEVTVDETEEPLQNDHVYALRDEEAYRHADDDKPQVVEPFVPSSIVCQFCGKSWDQVRGVFQAKRRMRDPNTSAIAVVWICNECVARMAQVLDEEPQGTPWLFGWEVWSRRGHGPVAP